MRNKEIFYYNFNCSEDLELKLINNEKAIILKNKALIRLEINNNLCNLFIYNKPENINYKNKNFISSKLFYDILNNYNIKFLYQH